MDDAIKTTLLQLNQRLLEAIVRGDWQEYAQLSDPELSAIEEEAPAQIVRGLDFHKYYFDLGARPGPRQVCMCQPVVHGSEDFAVVAYIRLVQKLEGTSPKTMVSAETRVWRQTGGHWRQIHLHRSPL